jgi:glycosyltransferase involved in cell wall biosynthesis
MIIIKISMKTKNILSLNNGKPCTYPLISVIITAKDEEEEIEDAINSRLLTDYPNIEFIIVNDRSEDKTGKIIDKLSRKDKRIKVLHLKTLPEGWLGKSERFKRREKNSCGRVVVIQ